MPKVPSIGSNINNINNSNNKNSNSIQKNKNLELSKISTSNTKKNTRINNNSIKNDKKRKELLDQYSNSIKNKIKSTFTQTKISSTNSDITSHLKQTSTNSYLYNINYDYRNLNNNNINNNNNNNNKLKSTNQDLVNRIKNKSSALKFSITSKNYYINIKNKNQNVNSFQLEEESNNKNKNDKENQDITKGVNILSKFDTFVHDIKYQQKDKNKFNKTAFNYYFDKNNNLKNTKSFDINFHKNEEKNTNKEKKEKKHIIIDIGKNKNQSKQDIISSDKNEINNNKENDKNKINIKNEKNGERINKEVEFISKIKEKEKGKEKGKKDINMNNFEKKDINENEAKNKLIKNNDIIKENNEKIDNNNFDINEIKKYNESQNEKNSEKIIKTVKEEKTNNEKITENKKEEKSQDKKLIENDKLKEKDKSKESKEKTDNKEDNNNNINNEKNKKEIINYNSPIKKSKSKKKKKNSKNQSKISPIIIKCKPLSPKHNLLSFKKEDPEDLIPTYFKTSKITNIQIPKDYLNIIYYNLLIEENENRKYFKAEYNYMNNQKEINEQMRSILIDWIIDVHGKFGFCDETLYMTVSIIDRYSSIKKITRNEYQCLGITALMIACKHEEINVPKVEDFIYITDNAYNKEEVFNMEIDILDKLNYNLLYPSPIKFFEYLSLHFDFDKKKHFLGKYLMETFLLNLVSIKFKPSIIACACTYIVMKFFKMKNYKESYSKKWYMIEGKEGFEIDNGCKVKDCAQELCNFVDNINNTNYLSCQKKYSTDDYCNISKLIINYPENNNKSDDN